MPSAMPIDTSGSACESGAVAIRPAIEVDLPTIIGIYAHRVCAGTASFEVGALGLAEMTHRFHALQETGTSYVVAEAGGALFGYAYAGPYRARPAYRHMMEDSIYFDTAVQRRGAGVLLLEAFIREYQARDFRQMVTVVRGSRENPGSAKLHAHCGFREVGVLEAVSYKLGRWLDCLLMQRTL